MSAERLDKFLKGVSAATLLKNRAARNGCFIETVCLEATIIDALLRIGLILKFQLNNSNSEINEAYLFQSVEDSKIGERLIYKRALENKIINDEVFNSLNNLYDLRNISIHRYIISDNSYNDIIELGIEYDKIISIINRFIYILENEQINQNTGMTIKSEKKLFDKAYFKEYCKDKINNDQVYKDIIENE
jgi:hypothetical protein